MINIVRAALTTAVTPVSPVEVEKDIAAVGAELQVAINARFGRSFHIRAVDTGSCGACESEINALSNPVYDFQRFGVDIVASPRHADALLVTGPLSRNMAAALRDTYDAMPAPKWVIACGACAVDGGPYKDAYYVLGGPAAVVPVAAHIPGCPPKPLDILKALLQLMRAHSVEK